jgi:hypothetical protein
MPEAPTRAIFKSRPLTGIMASQYFDLATPQHFWSRRRFEVLQGLADELLQSATRVAEIGCGNGVLRRQLDEPTEPSDLKLVKAGFCRVVDDALHCERHAEGSRV